MNVDRDALFDRYAELLLKWNEKLNLTSITASAHIKARHFNDSLAPLAYVKDCGSLLDLGTGAGFPGIPLKIAAPDLDVVLIDATRKKVSFCNEVIRSLGLAGIKAIQGRAEDGALIESLGRFDVVISRATWALDRFLEMANPYYNDKGMCIAMRGAKWKQELEEATETIDVLGLTLTDTHPYAIGKVEQRCLLIFKKRS